MIQFSCFCLIGNYAYPTLAYNIESRFKGDTFLVFSCENSNMFLCFDFIVILKPHKKKYVLRRGFASLWLEKKDIIDLELIVAVQVISNSKLGDDIGLGLACFDFHRSETLQS